METSTLRCSEAVRARSAARHSMCYDCTVTIWYGEHELHLCNGDVHVEAQRGGEGAVGGQARGPGAARRQRRHQRHQLRQVRAQRRGIHRCDFPQHLCGEIFSS